MTARPRLLDLFCGAGGAGYGYSLAGFEMVGVDIAPQPRYPFEFIQADALETLRMAVDWPIHLETITAIHASPPCQAYSNMNGRLEGHPNLIAETRELLEATGLPYIIENIPDAKDELRDPVMLCGTMFDPPLPGLKRHRLFEANWPLQHPMWPCRHKLAAPNFRVYEHRKWYQGQFVKIYGTGGGKAGEHWAAALDIDWMTRKEMKEAIPPVYTEFVGTQLMKQLETAAVA